MKIKNPEKYGRKLVEDVEFINRKLNKISYLLGREEQDELRDALETILNYAKDIAFILLYEDKQ
jgi:hypothetical protein